MVDDKIVKRVLILSIVAIIFILALLVIKPILIAIVFGLLFAYIFSPVFKIIYSKVKRKNLSAFLLILGIIIIIAIPIIWLTPKIVRQTLDIYITLQEVDFVEPIEKILPTFITEETATSIAISLNNLLGKAFTSVLNQFTAIIVDIPNIKK